jgi:phosphoglycolate phosphatase
MAKPRLLIFDFDGTLIDSADDYRLSVNRLMREENLPELSRKQVEQGLGHGLRSMVRGLFPHFQDKAEKLHELEEKFLNYYLEQDCTVNTALYPGVIEFLRQWPGQLALITNKSIAPTKKIMSHLGLLEFSWSAVFGFESLPERKPSALPLQTAMKTAGVTQAETVMIGDGIPDVQAARNAGVTSLIATFGYTACETLLIHSPTKMFSSYEELHQILGQLE